MGTKSSRCQMYAQSSRDLMFALCDKSNSPLSLSLSCSLSHVLSLKCLYMCMLDRRRPVCHVWSISNILKDHQHLTKPNCLIVCNEAFMASLPHSFPFLLYTHTHPSIQCNATSPLSLSHQTCFFHLTF